MHIRCIYVVFVAGKHQIYGLPKKAGKWMLKIPPGPPSVHARTFKHITVTSDNQHNLIVLTARLECRV